MPNRAGPADNPPVVRPVKAAGDAGWKSAPVERSEVGAAFQSRNPLEVQTGVPERTGRLHDWTSVTLTPVSCPPGPPCPLSMSGTPSR